MDQVTPRFHDAVIVPVLGRRQGVRVLVTPDGVVQPLLNFVSLPRHSDNSLAWQKKIVGAVGLLCDYMTAHPPAPDDLDLTLGPGRIGTHASATYLSRFVDAMRCGTTRPDGFDPTGLYWPCMPRAKVVATVRAVTAYLDYCASEYGAPTLNAHVGATFTQRAIALRAIDRRNEHSFFTHLKNTRREPFAGSGEPPGSTRAVHGPRQHTVIRGQPVHFPFDQEARLFAEGFCRSEEGPLWQRYHLRDLLIALLCRYGGLRRSEPLHLFVGDVIPTTGQDGVTSARVLLYHPAESEITYTDPVTRKVATVTRAEYLKRRFGLIPRSDRTDQQHSGWKDLMFDCDELYAEVRWFPPEAGVIFWRLWRVYVEHVRGALRPAHPWAFCTSRDETAGEPYTLKQLGRAFRRAVERIDLVSVKDAGTTLHGLRHAYAQSLERSGVPVKELQIAMHHKSPDSQRVYTQPALHEMNTTLQKAAAKVRTRTEAAGLGELARLADLVLPA